MRAATHRLVAYDGSAPARHALRRAVELAAPGDVVSVVNVMAEPGVSARIGPPKDRRRQGELLHEAAEYLAGHGIDAQLVPAVGNPAHEIVTAAEQSGADVIVLARHGGRQTPHILGSVTTRVVRDARCDVLVVHGDD